MKRMQSKAFAGSLIGAFLLGLSVFFVLPNQPTKAYAQGGEAVFSEDFEGDVSKYDGMFAVTGGEAAPLLNNGNLEFVVPLTESERLESNNYEVSFDYKLNQSAELKSYFYIHFIGLASNTGNVYFSLEQDGAWGCISSTSGGWLTSGTDAPTDYKDGSIIRSGVDLTKGFVNFRLVHYEGILELWADGNRWAATSLAALGNDVWEQRYTYTEGSITGFTFHFNMNDGSASPAVIDNIVIKEAVASPETRYAESAETEQTQSKVFRNEISGGLLGNSAYSVNAEYKVKGTLGETPQTVQIELCGLNALIRSEKQTGDHYSLDFAVTIEGSRLKPAVKWMDHGEKSLEGEALPFEGDTIALKVKVLGDGFVFEVNGVTAIEKKFVDDLQIYKGPLQVVSLINSENLVWTEFAYQIGESVVESVSLSSDKTTAYVGDTVTFTATALPEGVQYTSVKWYVDDAEVPDQTSLVYAMRAETKGTYKVRCKIDGVDSPARFVVVEEQKTQPVETPKIDDNGGCGCNSENQSGRNLLTIGGILATVGAAVLLMRIRR